MFNLVGRGFLSETSDGVNVSYVLNDSSLFFLASYKILQSQDTAGFVRCVKLKYNGKLKLLYLSSNYRTMQSMLKSLNADSFVTILSNLLNILLELKDHGFLRCPNIDLSTDKIFIDQDTLDVRLIYLPVNVGYSDADTAAFETAFRKGLANMIKAVPSIKSPKVLNLHTALVDFSIGLEQLHTIVNEEYVSEELESSDVLTSASGSLETSEQPSFTLTAIGVPNAAVFKIDKPEYVIGKNLDVVDGAVLYSTAVSRVHCKIIFEDGRYFVVDLDSANGTFVNNKKIAANTATALNDGDVLKLANCEFAVSN